MIAPSARFEGVGRSGMGAYHGKAGFDAFTGSMRVSADLALRRARARTSGRLKKFR